MKNIGSYRDIGALIKLRDEFLEMELGERIYKATVENSSEFIETLDWDDRKQLDIKCLKCDRKSTDKCCNECFFKFSFEYLAPAYGYSASLSSAFTKPDYSRMGFLPIYSINFNSISSLRFWDDNIKDGRFFERTEKGTRSELQDNGGEGNISKQGYCIF